jgi:hypothetical protein
MLDFEKNRLQTETFIDKRNLVDRLLDCAFHESIRRGMAHAIVDKTTEKIRFIETNDPGSYDLKIRADVYVFSPAEISAIAGEIKGLEKLQSQSQSYIARLQKDYDHQRDLLITMSGLSPPPVYIVDNSRIQELEGILKAKEGRVNERIAELEKALRQAHRAIDPVL